MFERFTDSARRAAVAANTLAGEFKSSRIGPEHLLLGLMVTDSAEAMILNNCVGLADWLKVRIDELYGSETEQGSYRFTNEAKDCLSRVLRESLSIGDNFIGTQHLFLGILAWEKKDRPGYFEGAANFPVYENELQRIILERIKSEPMPMPQSLSEAIEPQEETEEAIKERQMAELRPFLGRNVSDEQIKAIITLLAPPTTSTFE